jgi:sugar lactone lactonase YvrE
LGEGLFDRPHGLRIDAQDNIWTTDARSHVVYKFSSEGRVLLVLGVRDTAGEMHSYGHLRLFNEPNDMAFGPQGEIFVVQGHGRGEPKVIKFDKDGNFIKAWGKKGTGPGEFDIAHSIAIDAQGLVYVADRNNQRIQVFDADGKYLLESKHPGTPCGLFIDPEQNLWLAHGHAGRLIKLDLNGNVLGSTGSQGKGPGQFEPGIDLFGEHALDFALGGAATGHHPPRTQCHDHAGVGHQLRRVEHQAGPGGGRIGTGHGHP